MLIQSGSNQRATFIRSIIVVNGYLIFLKSLTEYQRRAEIGRFVFTERWDGSSLEEDLLKDRAIATFSESLGVGPHSWEFDLKHYAEEPDLIGAPVFRGTNAQPPSRFAINIWIATLAS